VSAELSPAARNSPLGRAAASSPDLQSRQLHHVSFLPYSSLCSLHALEDVRHARKEESRYIVLSLVMYFSLHQYALPDVLALSARDNLLGRALLRLAFALAVIILVVGVIGRSWLLRWLCHQL
jgi:hypothetical protein